MKVKTPFGIRQTWLQCIKCEKKVDLLAERKFVCPECGGLFDVEHDFPDIGNADNLKKVFARRLAGSFSSHGATWEQSGVWRYRELVMPYLPTEQIISLAEGNVPIIHAGPHLCNWVGTDDLWLILEGMTPTGSFKDFGGTVLMSIAKASGIKAVGCASTGDTSAMAAAYAAAAGIKCLVILPEGKVTYVQLTQPLVHGATVITLPGTFDDCMRVMIELVEKYNVYPANSLNPARIEGHQATAFQIAHFFGWKMPNWIALPVGNGSNCSSVGKGMRLLGELGFISRMSRILGCQSQAACPLAISWLDHPFPSHELWEQKYAPMNVGETTATAARIGNPVSAAKVMREIAMTVGAMEIAPEKDLNEAVAVCGQDGIFVCPQTGTALAGIKRSIGRGFVKKNETVVAVSTALGLKFTESASLPLADKIIRLGSCATSAVVDIMGL